MVTLSLQKLVGGGGEGRRRRSCGVKWTLITGPPFGVTASLGYSCNAAVTEERGRGDGGEMGPGGVWESTICRRLPDTFIIIIFFFYGLITSGSLVPGGMGGGEGGRRARYQSTL